MEWMHVKNKRQQTKGKMRNFIVLIRGKSGKAFEILSYRNTVSTLYLVHSPFTCKKTNKNKVTA